MGKLISYVGRYKQDVYQVKHLDIDWLAAVINCLLSAEMPEEKNACHVTERLLCKLTHFAF